MEPTRSSSPNKGSPTRAASRTSPRSIRWAAVVARPALEPDPLPESSDALCSSRKRRPRFRLCLFETLALSDLTDPRLRNLIVKALLGKLASHRAIGLYVGDDRVSLSVVSATILGPVEVARLSESYGPD